MQKLLARIDLCLKGLRIQTASNTGLLCCYSSATFLPLSKLPLEFTYFRTGDHGSDEMKEVQKGYSPFYVPSCDDIGHRICVQCRDLFGEGYSRFIESEPILADMTLVGLVESSIKSGSYRTANVSVSLGTVEKVEEPYESAVREADEVAAISNVEPLQDRSVEEQMLDRSTSSFSEHYGDRVLLDGTYTVHVDAKGVLLLASDATEGVILSVDEVYCSSPCSAIVSIPISEVSNGDKEEGLSLSAEEGRWLRCSLPSWNAEEMGEVKPGKPKEGQEESELTSYLNKFPISSSSTVFSVLKLCLVFPDRVARDAFVLTSRALAQSVLLEEMLQTLPWVHSTTGEMQGHHMSRAREATIEMGERLNHLELENVDLRLERTKLAKRLLEKGVGPMPVAATNDNDAELESLNTDVSELYAELLVQNMGKEEAEAKCVELSAKLIIAKEREIEAKEIADKCSDLEEKNAQTVMAIKDSKIVLMEANREREEQAKTIAELRDILANRDSEMADLKSQIDSLVKDQAADAAMIRSQTSQIKDKEAALEAMKEMVAQLEGQVIAGLSGKAKLEAEVGVITTKLDTLQAMVIDGEAVSAELAASQLKVDQVQAQANAEKKKCDAQGKELRRVIKENHAACTSFEKALVSKCDEVKVLLERLSLYEGQEGTTPTPDGGKEDILKRFTGSLNMGTLSDAFGGGSRRNSKTSADDREPN